jgi:hypothetical protein
MTCFCGVLDDLKICGLKRNNERKKALVRKSSTKGTENRIVNSENGFVEKLSILRLGLIILLS